MAHEDYVDWAIQPYQESSLIRALANLLPGGGAIDVLLTGTRDSLIRKRTEAYFAALAAGKERLKNDYGASEVFVHRFLVTSEAVVREGEETKISLFANLLLNGPTAEELDEADFKEIVANLREMTTRELVLLKLLNEYEDSVSEQAATLNEMQRASSFWPKFIEEAEAVLRVDRADLPAALSRIGRTGCYLEFTGAYLGYAGGMGRTTGLWQRLKRYVLSNNN